MKSLFEEMGGTYRQEGDYLIPNLALPDEPEYQIGKYGRMRRNYLKEHRPVLYANLLTSGTLHRHLAEIDQACNERMEIIVSDIVGGHVLDLAVFGMPVENAASTAVDVTLAPNELFRRVGMRRFNVTEYSL